MVVPVLMMSCHVSEKPKVGPVMAQTIMIARATTKAQALPRTFEVCRAKTPKASRIRQKKSRSSQFVLSSFGRFLCHASYLRAWSRLCAHRRVSSQQPPQGAPEQSHDRFARLRDAIEFSHRAAERTIHLATASRPRVSPGRPRSGYADRVAGRGSRCRLHGASLRWRN